MDKKTFSEELLGIHHFVEKLRDTNSVIYTRIQNRNSRLKGTGSDDGVRETELQTKVSTLENRFYKTDDDINHLQTTLHTLESKIDGLKTVLQRKVPSTKNTSRSPVSTGGFGPVKTNDKSAKRKIQNGSMIGRASVLDSSEDDVTVEAESRGCGYQTSATQNQSKSAESRSNEERVINKTSQFMAKTGHSKPRSTSKTLSTENGRKTSTTKLHEYSEAKTSETTQKQISRPQNEQTTKHGKACVGETRERHTTSPLTLSEIGFKRRGTNDKEDNRVSFLQNPTQFRVRRDGVSVDSVDSNIPLAREAMAADPMAGDESLQATSSLSKTEGKPDNQNSQQGPLETLTSDLSQETQRILTDYMERIAHQATSMRQEDVFEEEKKAAEALLIWNDIADKESRKVPFPRPPRGLGPDTVLCFDTSLSMSGRYLREMKEAAFTLIRGIEVISKTLEINENISVVTFGGDNRVLLHLTNDYQKVKSAIESLKVGGSTPMSAGLLLCVSASLGNGSGVTIADIPMKPKIILFSDGKGTPVHWKASTDDYDENNYIALANAEISTVSTAIRLNMDGYTVFCVPIGDANMRTLGPISRLTQGKIFQTSQIHRLVKTSQNMVQAANIVKECNELKTVSEAEPIIRILSGVDSMTPPNEDMEDIFDLAMTIFKRQLLHDQDPDISEDEIMQRFLKQFKLQQSATSDQDSEQQLTIPASLDDIIDDEQRLQESVKKWEQLADAERLKCELQKPQREDGPDTVLLLDTSQSMQGKPFHDMISLALKIVDGVQHISTTLDIHENIAVATFGKRTEVAIHLTNDYSRVKQTIKSLRPEGLSPVFAGLLMSVAGYLGNGAPLKLSDDITVHPRIILISDGKATPDQWNEGEDIQGELNLITKLKLETTVRIACQGFRENGISVYCVPVGDADDRLLEFISRDTLGKLIKPSEVNRLIHMSQNLAKAVEIVPQVMNVAMENEKEAESLLRALLVPSDETNDDTFHLAFNMYKKRKIKGDDSMKIMEIDKELPPIGTRVRRGPDWSWPDFQDQHGPGTVISHDPNGMIWVEWDLNAHQNCYFYKDGRYDVVIVDEKRILRHDEDIAVGCPVSRGKDWNHGDKDGGPGSVGVVCRVKNKNVTVRWPNKNILRCRFGDENSFDVKLHGEIKRYTKEEEDKIRSARNSENKSVVPRKADDMIIITKRGDLIESSSSISSNKLSIEEMNRRNATK